jgi:5-methylcytosine-specific restriction protein A
MPAAELVRRAITLASLLDAPNQDAVGRLRQLELIGELRRLIDVLGCEVAGEVEQLSSVDLDPPAARAFGEKSAAVLVERHADITARESQAWCRVGSRLRTRVSLQGEVLGAEHPILAEAFTRAVVSVAAADRILLTLDTVASHASADEVRQVETFLVEQVPHLTERQHTQVCRAIPDRFDPDGAEPREDLLRERSGIRVQQTRDGLTRWIVTMHPEAAGFLSAAVDARTAPRRQPTFEATEQVDDSDRRPLHQARLDALVSIATESLQHDSGRIAGTAVTMMVTVSLETLRSGLGTAEIAGIDEPICAATARRLSADAEIIPVVLGGPSEQLDQGRAQRLSTEPQRRALALRDRGCIWPGCTAPPGWCEVAHIIAWYFGGATDLDNLVLLCPFHHRRFDRDGWQLEMRDGARWLIPPPWVDPTGAPRRAGPLPELVLA